MANRKELEWEQHNRDEAAARSAQQDSAGSTHSPVLGPGRYGSHSTNIHVRDAVLAERERCAQAARSVSVEAAVAAALGDVTERDRLAAQAVIAAIAAAIHAEPPQS
ncbi:hypothetical protein [Ramlibacter sp.]|uniref:hypothetical protein n=1 Tax=Ramlibacter sp. TaxID=1917967 RepID=UPI002B725D11|nr:hypothetical protein [Ramlibacter sp.]HWI81752.1 hypothetical protein [Ramlibacter sp.]